MDNTIEIKCVMDSEFCKGNTWYQIRSMSDHVVYVYLDKYEFVGLPKCHFDMDNIRELKENKMQEKITLKVGDMLEGESLLGGKKLIITSFGYDRINVACGNFWNYPLLSEKYYVNGKLYARENIIVPDFKEEKVQKVIHDSDCSLHNEPAYPNGDCDCSVMSTQEITNDNIMEVLKHNGVNSWSIISDFNIMFDHLDVEFKNPNWLQIIEAHIGKKLEPLPKANPFDFAKCLIDAGFTRKGQVLISNPNMKGSIFWISIHEAPTYTLNGSINIVPTPANAKIIIEMAELAKDLK